MLIELRRAMDPEDMEESYCGICGGAFFPPAVIAEALADDMFAGGAPLAMGKVCQACLTDVLPVLGEDYPERFPEFEFYCSCVRRYREPVYASEEEAERAFEAGEYGRAMDAAALFRPLRPHTKGESR